MTSVKDKFVTVDGLKLRYIEEGSGPVVLLLHGASLGSSADVFIRNLGPLAKAGFRAIAYDQPGFGLSDVPADLSPAYRRDGSVPKFMDALAPGKSGAGRLSASGQSRRAARTQRTRALYATSSCWERAVCCRRLRRRQMKDRGAAVQERLERRMAAAGAHDPLTGASFWKPISSITI